MRHRLFLFRREYRIDDVLPLLAELACQNPTTPDGALTAPICRLRCGTPSSGVLSAVGRR